jgi:ATP-binding cassette subfamily F protein 3
MIFIREVTLSYGHKKLFNEISETVGPRDRIALVGSNGSGKTTLLRMLIGELSPDEGGIEKPDYATVGYLPQDGVHASGGTVREEAGKAFAGVAELKAKLDEAEAKLAELDPEDEEFYDLIDLMGGWETQLSSFEPEKNEFKNRKGLDGDGFFQGRYRTTGGRIFRRLANAHSSGETAAASSFPTYFGRTDQPSGCGLPKLVGTLP